MKERSPTRTTRTRANGGDGARAEEEETAAAAHERRSDVDDDDRSKTSKGEPRDENARTEGRSRVQCVRPTDECNEC
jgi:hypothetical protein